MGKRNLEAGGSRTVSSPLADLMGSNNPSASRKGGKKYRPMGGRSHLEWNERTSVACWGKRPSLTTHCGKLIIVGGNAGRRGKGIKKKKGKFKGLPKKFPLRSQKERNIPAEKGLEKSISITGGGTKSVENIAKSFYLKKRDEPSQGEGGGERLGNRTGLGQVPQMGKNIPALERVLSRP